jgi:hypothetical protein
MRARHGGGGLFETQFILVAEGSAVRVHIMPMRSSQSAMADGLKQLRRRIPAGIDLKQLTERLPCIPAELKTLLKIEVVEIH